MKSEPTIRSEWSSCQLKKLVAEYNELNNHNFDLAFLERKLEEQKVLCTSQRKISSRRYSYPPIQQKDQTGMETNLSFDET